MIESEKTRVCPSCGTVLGDASRTVVQYHFLPYQTGIGVREVAALIASLLTFTSLISAWIIGVTPQYIQGSGFVSGVTAELTGLSLITDHPILYLLIFTSLVGVGVVILSISPIVATVGETITRKLKKGLILGAIPSSIIPLFVLTSGYETGSALIIDSRLVAARSGLGPGYSLALFAVLGFITVAAIDWLMD